MYTDSFFSMHPAVLVAVFSLLWFVVGILVGLHSAGGAVKVRSGKGKRPAATGAKNLVEMYVGNLAYGVRERDLSESFKPHGKVVRARIIKNRSTGKSKGYGFVEMKSDEKPAAAIKALNGMELKGRKIVVNEAKSRSRE